MSAGPLVSVVVTGYRRPAHLRRTIESFLRVNTYPNLELMLADDGSPPELQAEMRRLPFDGFLLPDVNRGLGANTNAGLRAARGDLHPAAPGRLAVRRSAGFIEAAIDVMTERPEIGLVRLLQPQSELRLLELDVAEWPLRAASCDRRRRGSSHFVYTDTPTSRARAFVDFIGAYLESRYMQKTELDMRDRFNAQTRFRAAFIEGYHLFEHIGDDMSFNAPPPLAWLSARLGRLPVLRGAVRGLAAGSRRGSGR